MSTIKTPSKLITWLLEVLTISCYYRPSNNLCISSMSTIASLDSSLPKIKDKVFGQNLIDVSFFFGLSPCTQIGYLSSGESGGKILCD